MNANLHSNFIEFITDKNSFDKEFVLGALLIDSNQYNGAINYISGLQNEQISYLKSYIKYFGYDFNELNSWDELYSKVNQRIKELNAEVERLKRERWNAWYNKLIRNIKTFFLWVLVLPLLLLLIVSDIITYIPKSFIQIIQNIKKKKNPKIHITNIIHYGEKSSGNQSTQEINLSINDENGQERISIKDESKIGLSQKLADYILLSNFKAFNSKIVTFLFNLGIKIKAIPYLPDTTKYKLVVFVSFIIVLYLASNAAIKFTVSALIIMLAGFTISITHKACNNNSQNGTSIAENQVPLVPDTLSVLPTVDSLSVVKNEDTASVAEDELATSDLVFDYSDYYDKVQTLFSNSNSCNLLAGIGANQMKFIQTQDLVDHTKQNYFINGQNGSYYLHVIVYQKIQSAAFQVHHINLNTEFNAEILPVKNKQGEILYAVTIGEYKGIDINDLCELTNDWFTYCEDQENEIGIYYNG